VWLCAHLLGKLALGKLDWGKLNWAKDHRPALSTLTAIGFCAFLMFFTSKGSKSGAWN